MATVDKYKSKIGRLIVHADTLRYFAPPPGGGEHAGTGPGGGDRRDAAAIAMDASTRASSRYGGGDHGGGRNRGMSGGRLRSRHHRDSSVPRTTVCSDISGPCWRVGCCRYTAALCVGKRGTIGPKLGLLAADLPEYRRITFKSNMRVLYQLVLIFTALISFLTIGDYMYFMAGEKWENAIYHALMVKDVIMVPSSLLVILLSLNQVARGYMQTTTALLILVNGIGTIVVMMGDLRGDPALLIGFLLLTLHVELLPIELRGALCLFFIAAYVALFLAAYYEVVLKGGMQRFGLADWGLDFDCRPSSDDIGKYNVTSTDSAYSASPTVCRTWYLENLTFLLGFTLLEMTASTTRETFAHDADYESRQVELRNHQRFLAQQSSRELLENLLPASIVDRIYLQGTTSLIADYFEDVTVMFTDMKGFTAFSSKVGECQYVLEHSCLTEATGRKLGGFVYLLSTVHVCLGAVLCCHTTSTVHHPHVRTDTDIAARTG